MSRSRSCVCSFSGCCKQTGARHMSLVPMCSDSPQHCWRPHYAVHTCHVLPRCIFGDLAPTRTAVLPVPYLQSCAAWSERYRPELTAAIEQHTGCKEVVWRPQPGILKEEGIQVGSCLHLALLHLGPSDPHASSPHPSAHLFAKHQCMLLGPVDIRMGLELVHVLPSVIVTGG